MEIVAKYFWPAIEFVILYFLLWPMIIFGVGFLLIFLIYWFVWTFSPNQDAREETKKWADKIANNLNFITEAWARIWDKIFEIVFGLIGLVIFLYVILWLYAQ